MSSNAEADYRVGWSQSQFKGNFIEYLIYLLQTQGKEIGEQREKIKALNNTCGDLRVTILNLKKKGEKPDQLEQKEFDSTLRRYFIIPDNTNDEEIVSISIINDCLKDLNHSTQHRILDYFKSKFNVSEPKITRN